MRKTLRIELNYLFKKCAFFGLRHIIISQCTENKTKFYEIYAYTGVRSANVDSLQSVALFRNEAFFFEFLLSCIINGNVNNNDNVS
jgi:hypothetical protein